MNINDKIYDRIVDHMTDVRLYEESVQLQNRRIIKRHRKNLKDLLRKNIRSDVSKEISRFGTELLAHKTNSLKEFSTSQLDFHSDNLYKEVKNFYRVTKPSTKELLAEVAGPTMKGAKGISQNVKNISSGELVRIQSKVKSGLANNKSPNEIIADVLKTTKITEYQARTLTRTAITSTQTAALRKVANDNKEIIKGFMFTAILDSRTSPICSHHNGKIYDIDDKRFIPPLHWNCRSSLTPVLKAKADILEEKTNKINKSRLEKEDGSKINGASPTKESFGSWLKRQPMDIQKKLLGSDSAVDLFKEGKLKAEQFISPKGKALSIQALRRKSAQSTAIYSSKKQLQERNINILAKNPNTLLNNPKNKDDLRQMFILDSLDSSKTFSLTDYRGTSLIGKQTSRRRLNNVFDEKNYSADPITGEIRNTRLYEPDFNLYQERIDFMRNAKDLTLEQKNFIESFVAGLDDKVSLNQQTVVIENLRVVFQRYNNNKIPWDNFTSVVRAENRFAVQNVSRLLDVRRRERQEIFGGYLSVNKKEMPKVQILGKYYDLDFVVKNQIKDQKYIDNWRAKEGLALAKKAIFRMRGPARAYVPAYSDQIKDSILKNFTTKEQFVNRLAKNNKSFGKALQGYRFATKKRMPTDSWIETQIRKFDERKRRILDFEWSTAKARPSKESLGEVNNSVTKAIKLVASGRATDYDSLAINIGKIYAKDLGKVNPFLEHNLKKYHADGSRLLKFMEEQKLIQVTVRGKTRRGVWDADTGRASGPFGDTISREVKVINKDLLKLQEAENRTVIARRLGITEEKHRLYVKSGNKDFFDAYGNKTGIPIISRDKYEDYDPKQIDRDITRALNQASNTQYQTDPEFFNFMDDVVRFRDPRGNSKYYDSLNSFRHEILDRGEQGYGLMAAARYHTNLGKPFRTRVMMDSRGRIYHRGYLTPTGGELVRPFLNSYQQVSMTPAALKELRIQIGAMIGPGQEALTTAGRLEIFKRNSDQILELGNILLSKTQRDRRIREFLEHPLIKAQKGKEVPKIARMALEYARIHKHVDGNFLELAPRSSVFRLQNSKGEGPYRSGLHDKLFGDKFKKNQPSPSKEGLIYGEADEFGFNSIEQLNSWFSLEERTALAKEGFKIVEIKDVAIIDSSKKQVIFNKQKVSKLSTYKTKLMIENDASSSGAQIIALSTGDRNLAMASNVLPTTQKNRLYDLIAMDTVNDPDFLKIPAFRNANLTWEDLAKGAKKQNMVTFYGAGDPAKAARVQEGLADILEERGFLVITKEELKDNLRKVDNAIKQSESVGAISTTKQLKLFRRELENTVNKNKPVGRSLLMESEAIHPDVEDFVRKLTDTRKGLISPKDFSTLSRIMTNNLAKRAPVTTEFIQFWKKVAKIYVQDSKKVDIPWVTFDGKVMMQRYRGKNQERIEFEDKVSGRRVANIYEGKVENGKLQGQHAFQDASTGLGVNGNHSNDAVIVRQFHNWGRKNNIGTGTIHDAFFTNIGHADQARDALRTIYANALKGKTVEKTLQEMRRRGLSITNYYKLLNEAKKRGLINPPNAITRKEILAKPTDTKEWYGIGP